MAIIKKIYLFILLCFALVGCSREQTIEPATNEYRVEGKIESMKIHLDLERKEDLAVFEKAVNDSVKVPGIVNVASPMYTFSIGEDFYYLWITEESGSIMNRKDNGTLYTLSNGSVEEVNRYVNNEEKEAVIDY